MKNINAVLKKGKLSANLDNQSGINSNGIITPLNNQPNIHLRCIRLLASSNTNAIAVTINANVDSIKYANPKTTGKTNRETGVVAGRTPSVNI